MGQYIQFQAVREGIRSCWPGACPIGNVMICRMLGKALWLQYCCGSCPKLRSNVTPQSIMSTLFVQHSANMLSSILHLIKLIEKAHTIL